jgi:hypothetical protein
MEYFPWTQPAPLIENYVKEPSSTEPFITTFRHPLLELDKIFSFRNVGVKMKHRFDKLLYKRISSC